MFHDLGMYTQHFEVPFIEATTRYYETEAAAQLQARDVSSYLLHVRSRLQQEEQRVTHYLHLATRKPLLQTTLQMLLAAHIDAIIEKGFTLLMDENRVEDLTRMYSLYTHVDALPQMRQVRCVRARARAAALRPLPVEMTACATRVPAKALSSYIKRVGTAMVSDRERDRVLVQELLQFKEKLDRILAVAFVGNEQFGHTLKEAFEAFINVRQVRAPCPACERASSLPAAHGSFLARVRAQRALPGTALCAQSRPAELIARFIDSKLRTGNKGTTEDELEDVLDKTMTLFRFIDGKVCSACPAQSTTCPLHVRWQRRPTGAFALTSPPGATAGHV